MSIHLRLTTAAVALLVLSACSDASGETNPAADISAQSSVSIEQSTSPWAVHAINGWEVEWYDSLEHLVDAADLIAVGTVVEAEPGPTWVESEGGETMTSEITAYTVKLTDVLSGRPVGSTARQVTLEFGPDSPEALRGSDDVVGESSLFILRRKGAPIPSIGRSEPMKEDFAREVYRVVNSVGVIDEVDGAAVLPLEEPDQAWAQELERGSFTEAVERVRATVTRAS